jgi:hypothetical protein
MIHDYLDAPSNETGGEVVRRYADLCLATFGAIHPTAEDRIARAAHNRS